MKNYLVILISFLSLGVSFAQDTMFDTYLPIKGAEIKVGRRPLGGKPIAKGLSGTDGSSEFNNLPFGTGYYVEATFCVIGEGRKNQTMRIVIENIEINNISTTYTEKIKIPSKTSGSPEKVVIFTVTTLGLKGKKASPGKPVEKATSGLRDTLKTQV